MTKLSVNLNKIALLRNQRDIGYPDLAEHAQLILDAGADGLTVHPRPDERHIKFADVPVIARLLENKDEEFNIEGYPSDAFLELVTSVPCDQVTLVPDPPEAKTSDNGWDVKTHADFLTDVIARIHKSATRVSLFLNPDPSQLEHVVKTGTDRIELYTGPYAYDGSAELDAYFETAHMAHEMGLGINAGHDLNLDNLAAFLTKIPFCKEVSIGHAITSDALKMGWGKAVKSYLKLCKGPLS